MSTQADTNIQKIGTYFTKWKHYIVTIETYETNVSPLGNVNDSVNATYRLKKCDYKLISVRSIVDNDTNVDINIDIDIFNIYKSYTRAYYYNFLEEKQWKLFPDGFSGIVRDYYTTGTLKFERFIISTPDHKLKIEGLSTFWYPNGIKERETNFINGVESGTQTSWHIDGSIRSRCTCIVGVILGEYTCWNRDGTEVKEQCYEF